MEALVNWVERMLAAGGTDMAIAIAVLVVGSILLLAWVILPFAVIGVKGKIAALTRATNFNTAEIRAMRNENTKRAKRAVRSAE